MKPIINLAFLLIPLISYANVTLTEQEKQLIVSCEDNVDIGKKIYDPEKSASCLNSFDQNDTALLSKFKQYDEYRALTLLSRLNAIYDISDLYGKAGNTYYLRTGLMVMLEKSRPCVLCELELGPSPEKLFPWLEKYRKDKLEMTKKAVLSWEVIPANLKIIFEEYSLTNIKWLAAPITKREELFVAVIEDKYQKIMPKEGEKFDPRNLEAAMVISPYLSKEKREALKKAVDQMAASVSASTSSVSASTMKAIDAVKKDLSSNPSDSFMLLGRAFDNSANSGAFVETPFDAGSASNPSATLSDEEAKKISPMLQKALFKEIENTDIGKEAIAFSKTEYGKLNFIVADLKSPTTRGQFSPGKVEVSINKSYVEAAMQKFGVTREQLLAGDEAAYAKISRYVAPTFIHEYEGHQKQYAWCKQNGLPWNYYIGMETEAFSKGYLFLLQKQKAEKEAGNENYISQSDENNVRMAKVLKTEGYKGVEKIYSITRFRASGVKLLPITQLTK
ncbi:MAG: hypothetical protein Fur0012_02200 [Elusimicrobiota bacterium]